MITINRVCVFIAILFFCSALYLMNLKIGVMQQKISVIEKNLELAVKSKELSDQATDSAIRIREQIHEQAKQQMRNTEQALKENSDWADILVPDSVQRVFGKEQAK